MERFFVLGVSQWQVTWFEAIGRCADDPFGGHLVEIKSQEEQVMNAKLFFKKIASEIAEAQ